VPNVDKTRQTNVRENRRAFKNGQSRDTGNIIITGCTYNFMVVPVYQPLLRIIEVVHDRGMDKVGTILLVIEIPESSQKRS
jgi:hypothetical protein